MHDLAHLINRKYLTRVLKYISKLYATIPYFLYASNRCSVETMHMRRVFLTFVARICDNYQHTVIMKIRVNYSLCFNYMYSNDDKRQINSKILTDHKKTDLGRKMK